ncbi:thiamine phosphate synthase [Mucilaginibacter lappiensis]|jgi:thiamine-phosphate pyrophosphorylase|uniref:thiamine phosphate synthase n=1 Tax=Mucilaginibacter lappiensis TaxID=354630 RepID=UPI003D21894A
MQLIVISHPDAIANEARLINQLFENGLTRFHLRKPGYDAGQTAGLLREIDEQYHHYIALHQHHIMTQDFGIKRLHYTEQHRVNTDPEKLDLIHQQGYILSTSVHDLATLYTLKCFDNAFLGPVFNSISKPGYQAKWSDSFSLDKQGIQLNVIALGGIDLSNLSKIKVMNFDGAAVLGTVWNNPDLAISNFKNLKQGLPS